LAAAVQLADDLVAVDLRDAGGDWRHRLTLGLDDGCIRTGCIQIGVGGNGDRSRPYWLREELRPGLGRMGQKRLHFGSQLGIAVTGTVEERLPRADR